MTDIRRAIYDRIVLQGGCTPQGLVMSLYGLEDRRAGVEVYDALSWLMEHDHIYWDQSDRRYKTGKPNIAPVWS